MMTRQRRHDYLLMSPSRWHALMTVAIIEAALYLTRLDASVYICGGIAEHRHLLLYCAAAPSS